MNTCLSPNPNDRMGLFKSLESVPDRYRLKNHNRGFEDRDVWQEYLDEELFPEFPDASEFFYDTVDRAGRRWKEHMQNRGRHHALATPEDVGCWCDRLIDELTMNTVYNQYWIRIENFYSWLQMHTEYPHVYHPVWMAVTENESAREIWKHKLSGGNRKGGGWE